MTDLVSADTMSAPFLAKYLPLILLVLARGSSGILRAGLVREFLGQQYGYLRGTETSYRVLASWESLVKEIRGVP